MVNAISPSGHNQKNLMNQAGKAYVLACGVQAVIRIDGEQDPPGWFDCRLSSEYVGLSSFLKGILMSNSPFIGKKIPVFLRDRLTCRYCGKSALKGELSISDLTVDHVRPRAVGGTWNIENLVTACRSCNELKASVICNSLEEAIEFVAQQRELKDRYFIKMALEDAGYPADRPTMLDLLFAIERKEVTA